jgi:biotin synthase
MTMLTAPSAGQKANFFPSISDLQARDGAENLLHERASEARRKVFGNKIFVRGVVEVSNYCRQNCVYCGMRRENRSLHRFRAEHDKLAELLIHHRPGSLTDLNIQAGEDPVAVREVVLPLIQLLRKHTNLGISVCLGSLPEQTYDVLRGAGASIYILKFEAGDPISYKHLQCPGTFEQRLQNIHYLAESGWSVSSGFIAGLPGQTDAALMANFHLAAELPLDGCSVSPFIPGDETPLSHHPAASIDLTLNCMAALRLMRPDWIIPAVSALNLADGDGYRRGLATGANLVTINLTPSEFRADYLLYKRDRIIMTEERILKALSTEKLQASTTSLAGFYEARKSSKSTRQ